ncbi:MAG TPA: tetratricopeptide repeat protein [Thermoanaerobaculia bacterium]|jgi:tetratricopeptide (TPR) repeat protein|nr:tetratricopeptide repeat protein [Thermoanaerobaculia bacterium]
MLTRRFPLLAVALLAAGCASSGARNLDSGDVVRELRNRGLEPSGVVIPYEINEEMRAWAHHLVPEETAPEKRLETLLSGLVDPDKLKVVYEPRHTATAQEVFETRRANCLAFTSLFVGMAREIGVPAFYLDVDDVERFEKEGDLVVVSGHVSAGFDTGSDLKILDFSAAPEPGYKHVRRISDMTAIALFHSNRGGELLRTGKQDEALPWLHKAVTIDPELPGAWINYGVALRRSGDLAQAEEAYRKALEIDPLAVSAYQNLAALLRHQGKQQEAEDLLALSGTLGSRNPFIYLSLGDLSLAHGRIDEARRFYKRAMRLYRDNAEPYAAMGIAALASGDAGEAHRWMRKAVAIDQENQRVKVLVARLGG